MAAGVLAVVICLGSGVLWIGIPAGGMWLAGEVTTTAEAFLFFVLGAIPLTMITFGFLLFRINAVYERLRPQGRSVPRRAAWLDAATEERPSLKRLRAAARCSTCRWPSRWSPPSSCSSSGSSGSRR